MFSDCKGSWLFLECPAPTDHISPQLSSRLWLSNCTSVFPYTVPFGPTWPLTFFFFVSRSPFLPPGEVVALRTRLPLAIHEHLISIRHQSESFILTDRLEGGAWDRKENEEGRERERRTSRTQEEWSLTFYDRANYWWCIVFHTDTSKQAWNHLPHNRWFIKVGNSGNNGKLAR